MGFVVRSWFLFGTFERADEWMVKAARGGLPITSMAVNNNTVHEIQTYLFAVLDATA
jgi:hypothetical protein